MQSERVTIRLTPEDITGVKRVKPMMKLATAAALIIRERIVSHNAERRERRRAQNTSRAHSA